MANFTQGFRDELLGRRNLDGNSTFQLEAAAGTAFHALTGVAAGILLKKKFSKKIDSISASVKKTIGGVMEG